MAAMYQVRGKWVDYDKPFVVEYDEGGFHYKVTGTPVGGGKSRQSTTKTPIAPAPATQQQIAQIQQLQQQIADTQVKLDAAKAEQARRQAIIDTQAKLDAAKAEQERRDTQAKLDAAKAEEERRIEEARKAKEAEKPKVDKQAIIDWLKKQPEFLKLPKNMQDDMIAYIDILGIQDIETQEKLLKALDLAKSQSDPYFAEIIRATKDEITRGAGVSTADFIARQRDIQKEREELEEDLGRSLTFEEANYIAKQRDLEAKRTQLQEELGREISTEEADYLSQKRNIQLKIDQINENLATGKGRLSIDEQAELARQVRKYEVNLENLRENAAQKGLTFSSIRDLAETRLGTEQKDITESTKREFGRQLEDLQTRAARGETEAQNLLKDYERKYGERVTTLKSGEAYQQQQITNMLKDFERLYGEKIQTLKIQAERGDQSAINQLADYKRKYGEAITKIGRAGEERLGTAGLPSDLAGYQPLGGVTGKIEKEKFEDIMAGATKLSGLNKSFLP